MRTSQLGPSFSWNRPRCSSCIRDEHECSSRDCKCLCASVREGDRVVVWDGPKRELHGVVEGISPVSCRVKLDDAGFDTWRFLYLKQEEGQVSKPRYRSVYALFISILMIHWMTWILIEMHMHDVFTWWLTWIPGTVQFIALLILSIQLARPCDPEHI